MTDPEKPTIDKVTLLPDQPLTPEEEQAITAYLHNYTPQIIWEVAQRVTAYIDTKIIELYIRNIDPNTVFIGYLAPEGEIVIAPHQPIGKTAIQEEPREASVRKPGGESTGEPLLTVHSVPPGTEIQIKIKREK